MVGLKECAVSTAPVSSTPINPPALACSSLASIPFALACSSLASIPFALACSSLSFIPPVRSLHTSSNHVIRTVSQTISTVRPLLTVQPSTMKRHKITYTEKRFNGIPVYKVDY